MRKLIQLKLKILSQLILKKYKPEIIGITGSVGKTGAKEAVYAVLSSKYNVRRNVKNYNNEIGLPLTIIGSESPGKSIIGWILVFIKAIKLILIIIGTIFVAVIASIFIKNNKPIDKIWGIPIILIVFIIWRALAVGREIVGRNKIEKMSEEEREQYAAKLQKILLTSFRKESKIKKIIGLIVSIIAIGVLASLVIWLIYLLFIQKGL